MSRSNIARFAQRSLRLACLIALALGSQSVFAQQRGNYNNSNNNRGGDRRGYNNSSRSSATGGAASSASAPTNAKGMDAFRLITTKNIFDPDRRPMPQENGEGEQRREIAPPIRSGYLTLTGTMVAEGKALAFFNGSQSDFNRVVSVNDQVAGCTITGISSAAVDLKRGEAAIVLPVGKQLTLDGTSKVITPEVQSAPAESSPVSSAPPSGGPPSFSGPPSPGPSAASSVPAPAGAPVDRAEMIRKMMERRQKENSK